MAPSPQRTPVLFQATGSPAGIEFAGRHAEVVFTGGRTAEDFRRNATAMRDAARRHGRNADDLRFIVQAGVVVARTEEEAAEKWRLYKENTSIEGILAHASLPVDLTAFPPETLVADALLAAGVPASAVPHLRPDATVAQALESIRAGREDRYFVAGTPRVVADEIERWLDDDGVDGINLRQYHSFDTVRDFVDLVVPELRRRGRLREGDEPTTLRDRLFGRGHQLPSRHIARRYRGGANLDVPVEPLSLRGG